jgi:hypothetical protein
VAKMQEVSYLAMCQSVLIAWSVWYYGNAF